MFHFAVTAFYFCITGNNAPWRSHGWWFNIVQISEWRIPYSTCHP